MYVDLEQVRGLFFYGEGERMGGADADGGGQCMFFAGIPGLSTDGSVGLVGACVPSERFNAWPETATAQCCGPQSSHVQRRLEYGDAGAVEDGAVLGVEDPLGGASVLPRA